MRFKANHQTANQLKGYLMHKVAIVGTGPAGLTAGLYATRGGLENVTMFEKGMPGGQITGSSEIENYPGVTGEISGDIDGLSNLSYRGNPTIKIENTSEGVIRRLN